MIIHKKTNSSRKRPSSTKFRRRILLDRLLAAPLSLVCNALARGLGLILRRDHTINPAATQQIVVSKLVGMGSIIQATPLLRALKQQFPHSRLTFVTLVGNRKLVERLSEVDEVVCFDDRGLWPMLWTTMRAIAGLIRRRVDHYFDLEVYSAFACLLALFSLSRNRLGFYRHSNYFKQGIYTHLVYFNTRMPVRRLYLQLGRVAGVPAGADDRLGNIRVVPSERQSLQAKLVTLGLKPRSRYILVNPNASDLLLERRWPDYYMVEALMRLAGLGHNLVLIGSRSEMPFIQNLYNQLPESARARVFNSAGRLEIGEVLALIEGAACVLTNDTGPMHMAFVLGPPTVCLIGPADPNHYCVEQPGVVTLYAPVSCSPCIYEVDEPPCFGNNVCMQRLSPELVVQQILELLAENPANTPAPQTGHNQGVTRLPLMWETNEGQILGIVVRGSIRGTS